MGRVRPVFIKKISKELISKYSESFTDDFGKNKKILEQFVIIQSKLIRNRIAGYIVHLVKSRKNRDKKLIQ
ncbi:MAG: 30S ribosomal protein S17e [Promethearchaeota archaeon]